MKKQPVTAAEPGLTTWQRRYLYLTAAITGGAIMIVEILGAKMLAPYVGTSHFVWTAQITVTMVALAAGYYAGGRLVDRSSNLSTLYWAIVAAAAYLCLAVVVVEPITYGCLQLRLPTGTLLASTFLFFVPLALLAMTGPFVIRVLTSSVNGLGGNVGRLTAISTLGSVAGTLLIGYFLIPFLPNSWTMFCTAAILIGTALVYRLGWSRRTALPQIIVSAVILGISYPAVGWSLRANYGELDELLRKNSHFGMLQVMQQRGSTERLYVNDYLTQNTYDTVLKGSLSMFTYMLHDLARTYSTNIQRVLCIGLGVGIVPMEFAREGATVDVIEINPAIVPVGKSYFGLEPEKLKITIGDGRYFVNESKTQYDAIILDAFLGDSCPSHLMTREAFSGMKRILKPEGVLVINTFCDFETGRDFFGASLSKTLRAVFGQVRIHQAPRGGNALFVASARQQLDFVRAPAFEGIPSVCRGDVEQAFKTLREADPAHGRILRDDYNPVEFYDAENRENLRKYLAAHYMRQRADATEPGE